MSLQRKSLFCMCILVCLLLLMSPGAIIDILSGFSASSSTQVESKYSSCLGKVYTAYAAQPTTGTGTSTHETAPPTGTNVGTPGGTPVMPGNTAGTERSEPNSIAASWMPPKQAGEVTIGLMGASAHPDRGEQLFYRHLGELQGLDYIIQASDRYGVLTELARIRRSGTRIRTLVVAGHGDATVNGIQISSSSDIFQAEYVDRDLLAKLHGELADKRQEFSQKLCELQHVELPTDEQHKQIKVLQKQFASATQTLKEVERRLEGIDGAWGVVPPDGLVVLINCFAGQDEVHLNFSRKFGRVLFGDGGGTMMVSTTAINIHEITNFGFFWQLWGKLTEGYWHGPGETYLKGDWRKLIIPALPKPEPGSIILPVWFSETCQVVAEDTPVQLEAKVTGFADSKKLKYSWQGACTNSEGRKCNLMTRDLGDKVLATTVAVQDERGRIGRDKVCVWVDPAPARIDISLDDQNPEQGSRTSARAKVIRGKAPPDAMWIWRAIGDVELDSRTGQTVTVTAKGDGKLQLRLFGYGPFGKEKVFASAELAINVRHRKEPPQTAPLVHGKLSFNGTAPGNWEGGNNEKGFHFKRTEMTGGGKPKDCPSEANVNAEVFGTMDPSFAPRTQEEIKTKLNAELADMKRYSSFAGAEIKPYVISGYQGYLMETKPRLSGGTGNPLSGYTGLTIQASGHGYVTRDGKTAEVSYAVTSGGCWNRSQRPFQESTLAAAQSEVSGILASLQLIENGRFSKGVVQAPQAVSGLGASVAGERQQQKPASALQAGQTQGLEPPNTSQPAQLQQQKPQSASHTKQTQQQKPATIEVNNGGAVVNGPRNATMFSFPEPVQLVFLGTYHWNNRRGTWAPGQIGLKHQDGTLFGPWQAKGRPGQGGVANAYWEVTPNVRLKPGNYTVIDSDPGTWSTNAAANWQGFTTIRIEPSGQR